MINIKDVQVEDVVQFNEHFHLVMDMELDCTNLQGIVHKKENCQDGSISIEIKLDSKKYSEELEDWNNCLIFNFPHDDDYYKNVNVVVLKNLKKERDKIKTYSCFIPISGSLPVSVEAESEEEALKLILDGQYESEEFSLQDCELETEKLSIKDIDYLD